MCAYEVLAVLCVPMDNASDACPLPHHEGRAPLPLCGVSPGALHYAMLLKHMLRISNDFARQAGDGDDDRSQ